MKERKKERKRERERGREKLSEREDVQRDGDKKRAYDEQSEIVDRVRQTDRKADGPINICTRPRKQKGDIQRERQLVRQKKSSRD